MHEHTFEPQPFVQLHREDVGDGALIVGRRQRGQKLARVPKRGDRHVAHHSEEASTRRKMRGNSRVRASVNPIQDYRIRRAMCAIHCQFPAFAGTHGDRLREGQIWHRTRSRTSLAPRVEPRYDRDRLECASSRCQGEEAQLDVFSSCGRLEVIDISGSKVAVDVGRSRTGSGLRALAAACAATVLMSVSVTAALASSPPPPPPAPSGGGGGGTPPPANVTPSHPANSAPPDRHAPGKVGHLHTITKVPGRITLLWTNPGASDLAGVVVRRGWAGACPTSQHDGVAVGGTAVRTRQIDTGAVDGQRYCYAIFAFDHSGNYSRAAVAHSVMNPGDRTAARPRHQLHRGGPGRPRRALVAKPAACRRRVRCRAPRYGHQQLPHRPAPTAPRSAARGCAPRRPTPRRSRASSTAIACSRSTRPATPRS